MKIAAIVAEYNPFHNGHKFQLDRAREILGSDTAIISVMSGNYTQRGELAIADKLVRAEAAVMCGVDLVLELPHPYSMSSAEFFAKSSIYIIEKLGVVDFLVFGVEDSTIYELNEIANISEKEEFKQIFYSLSNDPDYADLGYPKLFEETCSRMLGKTVTRKFFSPNNILAIEYLRALKQLKSKIKPLPISRKGARYNDVFIPGESLQSASAIRSLIKEKDNSAFDYVPCIAKNVYSEAMKMGKMPSDESKLSEAVIASLRLKNSHDVSEIHDAMGGLNNRLSKYSFEANNIHSLMSLVETKKYTKARIRRAMWNTFFGVTSSEIKTPPAFTQILGLSECGREVLRRIPKMSDFCIFTKPSLTKGVQDSILTSKKRADRADSIYGLSLNVPNNGNYYLTISPFVKK